MERARFLDYLPSSFEVQFKHVEGDQAKGDFTRLVLSLATMVSTTTIEVMQQALSTAPAQKVLTWRKQPLGESLQEKQRKAFLPTETREQ